MNEPSAVPPATTPQLSPPIQNDFLCADFDAQSGQFQVWHADGRPLLTDVVVVAHVSAGDRRSSDPEYSRSVAVQKVDDRRGEGQRLVATCTDAKHQLDLEIRMTLYESRSCLILETLARNPSDTDIVLPSLEPLRVVVEEGRACHWPGATKVLTNGRMYSDPVRLLDFDPGTEVWSWWNLALSGGHREPALVIGYLGNPTAMGEVMVRRQPADATQTDVLSLVALSSYRKGFVLKPGARVSSDRIALFLGRDPFAALESYAQTLSELSQVYPAPIVNGWCSRYSTYGSVTEEEVLHNATFAARHLTGYGFEYIQVDDGYYRKLGDWEGNDRFPHGMKWLATKIHDLGLKPGLWVAPYCVDEGTSICRDHPDWLFRNPDGSLKEVRPGLGGTSPEPQKATPKLHALDITHPDAARWFQTLLHTLANEWGYDFIKVDFVDWSILAADHYADPSASQAAVYRKGIELLRKALGPDKHLLDCGPGNVSIGLLDSLRIEIDHPPITWNQYYRHPASSAPAAAKRYYLHNRAWNNDTGPLVMMYLTIPQARAAASVIGLSGGTVMSGDRLPDLDEARLEILKKILPGYGQAARPVDLFERDRPELFALRIRRHFGRWFVLGVFNADEAQPAEKTIPVHNLGLDPELTYLAYDFWEERFVGEITGTLTTSLGPSSCKVMALHEKRGTPQVLSTSRHFTQGAIELETVQYDPASNTLRGVSLGPLGSEHHVHVYLPEERPWESVDRYLFHDFPGYTVKVMEPHILRVHVRFPKSERVEWQVRCTDY